MLELYQVKVFLNRKDFLSYFFEKRKDAKEFAESNRLFEVVKRAVLCRSKVKLSFHHTALCSGYVAKGKGYIEAYKGKFGEGVKIHYPNADPTHHVDTKEYHVIKYYVKIG